MRRQDGQEKSRRREKIGGRFQRGCVLPFCGRLGVVRSAAQRKNSLCEENARGNWDPREGQQPFRPNPNGVRDHTTTLRRLFIGAA